MQQNRHDMYFERRSRNGGARHERQVLENGKARSHFPAPSSPRHGSGTIALQILRALQRRQNLVETTGRRGAAAEKARRTGLTAPRRQKLKLLDMYTYKECFNPPQTQEGNENG
jgi:hypothetical protein